MDLCPREIVGWSMDSQMPVSLVQRALTMAYDRRRPAPGLLHHSDRGSQYACDAYQKQLRQYGMIPSMSRKGNCWDNAPMERFFRNLKSEHLYDFRFRTRAEAKKEVLEYITFYNAYRLNSALNYMTPMEYGRQQVISAA